MWPKQPRIQELFGPQDSAASSGRQGGLTSPSSGTWCWRIGSSPSTPAWQQNWEWNCVSSFLAVHRTQYKWELSQTSVWAADIVATPSHKEVPERTSTPKPQPQVENLVELLNQAASTSPPPPLPPRSVTLPGDHHQGLHMVQLFILVSSFLLIRLLLLSITSSVKGLDPILHLVVLSTWVASDSPWYPVL